MASHAGGISFTTNNGAAWTHHNTTNGLPSNDAQCVAYFGGAATATRWLVGTNGGVVLTTNTGTSYAPFRRGTVSGYWQLNVSHTTPASTAITYQILDGTGTLIPDATLPGNSAGLTPDGSGNISLASIPIGTYPTLQVRANLSTSLSTATPAIQSLRVRFVY